MLHPERSRNSSKRHLPRRATRLSVWPRWPSRAKAGKTASALRIADLRSTDSPRPRARALLPDDSSPLSIACQDGAQASAVNNLFLRSRLRSPRLGGVAQPSGHPRARCMHSVTLQSRAPRRSGAGNTRLMTAGRPQSSLHTGHQSLWLRSFCGNQGSI